MVFAVNLSAFIFCENISPGVFGNSQMKSRAFWRTRCLICVRLSLRGPSLLSHPGLLVTTQESNSTNTNTRPLRMHHSWPANTRSVTSGSSRRQPPADLNLQCLSFLIISEASWCCEAQYTSWESSEAQSPLLYRPIWAHENTLIFASN